jgi:cyclase
MARVEQVLPGVFTLDHEPADGKNALLVTRRGAWAIDAGNEPSDGIAIRGLAADQGRRADRLILTHGHNDHVFGCEALAAETIVATTRSPAVIRSQAGSWARRFGGSEEEALGRLPRPTLLFDGRLVLDEGDGTIELFATPGHSDDGLSIWVPEKKLLVCGDTVVTAIPPAIGNGDSRVLERSLLLLLDFAAETLVCGHGPPLRGAAAVRGWIEATVAYLRDVRDRVRQALAAGADERGLLEAAPYDALIGQRLPRERFGMEKRHANVVAKVGEEERR